MNFKAHTSSIGICIFTVICMTGIGCSTTQSQAQPQPQHRVNDGSERQGLRHQPMDVVELPEPTVTITIEGEYRVITTNGLPNHEIGEFPNPSNPNALRSQNKEIRIPQYPTPSGGLIPSAPEFGVALNGVIFDSGTGEFWTVTGERGRSAWNYDASSTNNQGRFGTDFNHAHVNPTGKYHYHGVPTSLLESLAHGHIHDDHAHEMIHLGWAFDGYPIYAPFGYEDPDDPTSEIVGLTSSYQLKHGTRPGPPDGPGNSYDGTYAADYEYIEGSGDLDRSNGRTGVTPEFADGTYYYIITNEFPSVPRTWVGTPGPEFNRRPPGDAPRGMHQGHPEDNEYKLPGDLSKSTHTQVQSVNPAYFMEDALAAPIVKEERILSDGTTALCYVIRTYSEPHEHEMGPWAPTHIDDDAGKGGIWLQDGEVHNVDGPFVRDIAEFYDDPDWKLYREDGSIRVTDTKQAFEAAARPNVDPKYHNYVVEGRPEWIDRNVFVYVIPVNPIYQAEPTLLGRAGSPPDDRFNRRLGGGPPPRGNRPDGPPPVRRDGQGSADQHQRGGAEITALGIAFNGVNYDPPAPVDAILAAHTLAPFDDAGGHINPHNGYHYHAVTGHTKEIVQHDGHAPMIGYMMDGFGLYAHANEDETIPNDLDECGGHTDSIRGYHYHAGAAGENQIIKGFRGIPGSMTVEQE